ncbi:zinc finger and BTB domain-containing protein 10 isoform X1 [Solea senegalensis]|uniref:Zinc finger and BTB domain-containing protein 10 isoform X1 n=1 Tax=Solea senegalensis TaxID=28829 RepID=A0AAV6R503_SOLSE|nr:zinc finger and BTB domain-containing protein 10 isoform X1 [Solea senegalensis]KAG7500238.1 zinc finger and BTB domain-containing protein 10 isoform X1 [Solea senegalensis]
MSGERNRRSLAFRGGGLAGLTGSSGIGGGNCNSWEAPACQDRHFNGNRPDQEEDRDLGAKGPSQRRVEGTGSVSDCTEPEAEEEEDPEGGSWAAGDGDDRVDSVEAEVDGNREGCSWTTGNGPSNAAGQESGSGETGSRKSGVEMRPQTLLQKHSLFHASWLQEFPWLKFCQETGLMSCSWCHNIATKNSDELVKGSRNYKRALLLRHHLSSEHGRNDPTKQETRPSDNTSPSTNCSEEDYRNKPNENSYCYQLLQELDKQRKSGILCDVNIVVSGQVFRAHKNILVAGSRYFKTLYCLTKSEAQDQATVTHLDVAAVQGFSVILDFLYSGNLLLTSQNAIEVMSVASYLQMTEVVQSCRAFIKDALNISSKQEAPDSVVVDYNKRQMVAKEGQRRLDRKPSNFWATSILSKLSIKASSNQVKGAIDEEDENGRVKEETSDIEVTVVGNEGCALVTPGASGSWSHHNDNSSDSAETNETRAVGDQAQVFIWNGPVSGDGVAAPAAIKREAPDAAAGSGRRKKQATTRRFVYNFPPEPEEGFDEGMFIQPSASYPREDFSSLSENAELANQIPYSIIQDLQQGESWENGESSHLALNKLKCPHCNYIAKHRRTLKRHLIIHSGVRSFSCDICGKLFTRREHVKRHSLVHKKDKKYKCMVCKKIFMLAASVGIRHGSRRYGVCADCADSHQATQEGLEGMDFPRDEDFEGEEGEDLEGEEPTDNDQSNWGEGNAGGAPEKD